MENLIQTQLLLTNSKSFSFNTNIFETNVINITILVIVLFLLKKDILGKLLSERQNEIINSVQDSEKRLNEATKRLEESKKQLSQARVIIDEIKKEAVLTKDKLLEKDYLQAHDELNRRFNNATLILKNRERLILREIKQNISFLALKQVISTLEKQTGMEEKHISYMQESIKMVGEN